ncbi:diguanylate cyclase [Novosphingobium naphthalenivorans]|uniref:diguanylate cyclase n=1 Tax=Novosphingobium naphthalenivorans TaxID=273168 RepID=UPI00082A6353|nr:diguanylate cyclase [Novosphingobium naphthalenivorans]
MDANLMRTALTQLDQALTNHEEWSEEIVRALICHVPLDSRDTDPEAHMHCRFGQWYYGDGARVLHEHPGFTEIAVEHQQVHELAAALLQTSAHSGPPSPDEFERFATVLKRMRLEVLTMKRELEDALSNLDPLTGAENRTSMLPHLREQLRLVRCDIHACAIGMLDIDNFKSVNDEHGHCAGDKVLKAFARLAAANILPQERFFRFGGEEFLLCMPGADITKGTAILEKIRTEFAAATFQCEDHAPFHVTVSAGLTMLAPDVSVETSIDRADKALYAAKAAGRNRTQVWTPVMA